MSSVLHTIQWIHSICQPDLLIGPGTLVIALQFISLHPQNYISWIFSNISNKTMAFIWFVWLHKCLFFEEFHKCLLPACNWSSHPMWQIWPVGGLRIYIATNYRFSLSAVFLAVLISTSDYFCFNFACRRILVILSLASFLMLHLRLSNTFSNLCGLDATTQITSSGYSSVLSTCLFTTCKHKPLVLYELLNQFTIQCIAAFIGWQGFRCTSCWCYVRSNRPYEWGAEKRSGENNCWWI